MAQHTDPLSGARYPDDNEPPSIAQFIQNGVNDLSSQVIPRFATTAARTTAYANWVAAGNSMVSGLMCVVGTNLHQYDATNSRWFKVPGVTTKLYSVDGIASATSGSVIQGAAGIGAINAQGPVPAHTPGGILIEVSCQVNYASLAQTAGQLQIAVGTTSASPNLGAFGARPRFNNMGALPVQPVVLSAYLYSDGTPKYLWLLAYNDAGSGSSYTVYGSAWQVWQL